MSITDINCLQWRKLTSYHTNTKIIGLLLSFFKCSCHFGPLVFGTLIIFWRYCKNIGPAQLEPKSGTPRYATPQQLTMDEPIHTEASRRPS